MFRLIKGFALAFGLIHFSNIAAAQSSAPEYPAYGTYNGFLNQLNILECDNLSDNTVNANLQLFSNDGAQVRSLNISVPAKGSSHTILNDQTEIKDTYGTFRLSLSNSANSSYFNCRTLFYRLADASSLKSYDFTYAMPLRNSSAGELSGIYNSINPLGKSSATQNWLSIVNTSQNLFSAIVEVYDQDGRLGSRIPVNNLAPLGRIDLGLGHPNGQETGIYKIVPTNANQDYQSFLIRYGLEEDNSAFSFAFPLDTKKGSCNIARLQASTMASTFTQNWLVLGNSGSTAINIDVDVNDRAGTLLQKSTVSIPAYQQNHIFLNEIIDPDSVGNVGSVKLNCSNENSKLIAESSFYGTHDLQSVSWAYVEQSSSAPQIKEGEELSFAINTFLGMSNWIKLAQNESKTTPLEFSFYDSSGLLQLFGENRLAPSSTIDFDVHSNFPKDKVGSANFKLLNSSSVNGYLLRTIPDSLGRIGNIIFIPGSILPEKILPKISAEAAFTGNPQSLAPYNEALSAKEIDYFLSRTSIGGSIKERNKVAEDGLSLTVGKMLNLQNPSIDTYMENPAEPTWNEPKVAWMQMMIEGQNPFHEKMALIWHDLFATSCKAGGTTVNCATHIELLRKHALGNFKALANELTIDYTMLEWLNGTRNTAEAPDENFSREFWELFTLGETSQHIGPYRLYDNQDIVEASRSFTGWQVWVDGPHTVGFRDHRHDDGEKTIWKGTPFEATGNFNNYDIVNLTLDTRPESAQWIAKRLFSALVHDSPSDAVVNQIASQLIASNWELKPVLNNILRSEAMFSEEARNRRVKDAVTYLIGFLRKTDIPYNTDRFFWNFSHQYTGYEPTQPISVAGWPINKYEGAEKSAYFLSWLTGYSNYITRLVDALPNDFEDFDSLQLIPKSRFQPEPEKIVDELSDLLGVSLNNEERNILISYVGTERKWNGEEIPLDLINNKEGLETKIRGTLWFLTQHRDYLTY